MEVKVFIFLITSSMKATVKRSLLDFPVLFSHLPSNGGGLSLPLLDMTNRKT